MRLGCWFAFSGPAPSTPLPFDYDLYILLSIIQKASPISPIASSTFQLPRPRPGVLSFRIPGRYR
jgi:hypothetical protein